MKVRRNKFYFLNEQFTIKIGLHFRHSAKFVKFKSYSFYAVDFKLHSIAKECYEDNDIFIGQHKIPELR